MKKQFISIIVTCYNEVDNIEELYNRIKNTFKKIPRYDFELLYVDNNSTDNSERVLESLSKKDIRVKIILMSRNFGSPQSSFVAGLTYAKGSGAFLLHGDIQDPPEMLSQFIEKWEKGYQVVYGIRNRRKGYGLLWNFYYRAFYFILKKLAYVDIPLDAGEFSLIDRRVIDELLKLEEYDYLLRCLRAFVGFKQIGVEYVRDARKHGRSTESFISGLWWAKSIIINFSFKPLTLISQVAFIVMLFSFVFLVINVVSVLTFKDSPRGIPTVIILILFLGGIQLLSLSIIAEYLAKIFLEVKRRPKFIVRKTLNITNR